MSKKVRLDQLIVTLGMAETRSRAQALIMAGSVRIGDMVYSKPGELVAPDSPITLAEKLPYVSRGGFKLAHALDTFQISPEDLTIIDVGASTGGFTDVLLQRRAMFVYAVDVGYGQIDYRLRQDPRVLVLDRTNIRHLERLPAAPDTLPSDADILADSAVIDVSFISLKLVLPAVVRLLKPNAWIITLIKPQFEAGADQVGKGGVIRNPKIHTNVLSSVLAFAESIGLPPHGVTRSPITGPAGNIEFLAWLGGDGPILDIATAIQAALAAEQ
jgi:23S rRNA (cytidine1920-2'-O)/16S rRNA (cytidine1409-2'-O)-methyltransferase